MAKRQNIDQWERNWQKRWAKAGTTYELPPEHSHERDFLMQTRTPEAEKARLKRINDEFIRGFRRLSRLGPAVTVFGSARFKERHRYYKMAVAVGRELAKAQRFRNRVSSWGITSFSEQGLRSSIRI